MPLGDVYMAMETGTIDGIVYLPPSDPLFQTSRSCEARGGDDIRLCFRRCHYEPGELEENP